MADTNGISSPQLEQPLSIGNWILTYIILIIPLLNLIMLLIWALSSNTNKSKQNFARASFIIFFFFTALSFAMMATLGLSVNEMVQQSQYQY